METKTERAEGMIAWYGMVWYGTIHITATSRDVVIFNPGGPHLTTDWPELQRASL
jgi:hypothetical protein